MTDIDIKLAIANGTVKSEYKKELLRLIHLKYDVNDEIDLLLDPDEAKLAEHNAYVSECKKALKERIRALGGVI